MLELTEVCKIFNGGTVNERRAIDRVSLKLEDGDFGTVIGGNGAGKSTLLNLIAGVYPCDGGGIALDGKDLTRRPEHVRAGLISRVFQDPMRGTAADMEIEENLAMANRRGKKRGLRWEITKEERALYRERLRALGLGLEDRLTAKAGLLSGGQRQALTLLMATLQRPRLLLLDEHTAALDPKTARNILALTERIVTENRLTSLMVTHNMRDAVRMGNRLVMMDGGRIIYDVSGEEKRRLRVEDLMEKFESAGGGGAASDRMLLV